MDNRETFDIAIIGLGPAGSTLARLLDKNLKVAAIDKKSPDGEGFRKPCGGLLSPDAQRALSRFGLTLPKEILVDPQIFAVDTFDFAQNLRRRYQRFYINVDRHKFDLWLMSLIPPNVEIITRAICVRVEKSDGFYLLYCIECGQEFTITAKYVVGADGANSKLRSVIYPKLKISRRIAIQQWFNDINPRPFYSCIFDSALTDCYAWRVSKDGSFILGGAFPLETGMAGFQRLKQKARDNGFIFEDPFKTEACLVLKPNGLVNTRTGKDGAFLTGEAAGFISPSSLEGISYALDSAYALAQALNQTAENPNRKYFFATLKIQVKILVKNLKSFFLYSPFLRKIVMKSGVRGIEIVNIGDDK